MLTNADDRQTWILELVREKGFASIEHIADHFDVTQQTIRRVVNQLCEQGVLRRVHGGVGLPAQGQNLAYESRQAVNIDAKRRIARAAAALIPDGATLMIGIGTTPECVAQALAHRRELHVITNSLNVAIAFARNAEVEITFAGGTLRPRDRDVIGDAAASFFTRYRADVGIYGVGGIDDDGALLDFHAGEVDARLAIAANCRSALLVADHSKFGRSAVVRGGHLGDVPHFVTDASVTTEVRAMIETRGGSVHIADAE